MDTLNLDVRTRVITRWLVILTCLWPILDLATNYWWIGPLSLRRIFNVAREGSVPSLYSAGLLVLVGASMLLIGAANRRDATTRSAARRWTWLGGLFLYMGVDDAAELHERLSTAGKELFGLTDQLAALPTFTWQLFYAPVFVGMGLLILAVSWWDLKAPRHRVLLLGTLACFVAAVGCDAVEGYLKRFPAASDQLVATYGFQHGLKVVEETIEMAGAAMALVCALQVLAARNVACRVGFLTGPAAA